MNGPTEAEKDLQKRCRQCRRLLPIVAFPVRTKGLTVDGRRYRQAYCGPCRHQRTADKARDQQRINARDRAARRLTRIYPEVYAQLVADEMKGR